MVRAARTLRTALLKPLQLGTRLPAHVTRIMGTLPLRSSMTSGMRAASPSAVRLLPRRVPARGRPLHVYLPAASREIRHALWRRFADDRDLISVKILLLIAIGILTAVLEAVI